MTLVNVVRPTRKHSAWRYDADTAPVDDTPDLYARYRKVFHGIGLVCPAERLDSAAIARWVRKHGLAVAAHTSDELAQALSFDIEPARLMVFGDHRQWGPIRCAVNADVRQFVVDACEQVEILERCTRRRQQVLVDVNADRADEAIAAICASERLDLVGLHAALDARSSGAHRYAVAIDAMVAQMARIHQRRGTVLSRLSLAGPVSNSPRVVADVIETAVEDSCARYHFPRPSLGFTPR